MGINETVTKNNTVKKKKDRLYNDFLLSHHTLTFSNK